MATPETGAPDYEGGGLSRETNWWGAFVIGLAGTILVTGIAPVMVTSLGAASVPLIVFITITGYLLCLLLAELSAMMPERTGGSPSYAYVAYKDKWPRAAKHINGATAWMYWLGWFPVAPLNMILASFYLVDKFGLSQKGFTPIQTPIAYWTVAISIVGIVLVFIPAYLGIRLGAVFATVLGLLSMIPLTFLAIAPIFRPSVTDWGQLSGFHQLDGTGFFTSLNGDGWLTVYLAYAFLLTWNVIAMEAAACYIGECRDPERDAKIAMNLEGLYGLFIYTMIPISFIVVLGASALGNPALVDPATIFSTFAGKVFSGGGNTLNWLITIMLVVALALSALNAIMGCGRSLHQMSIDGAVPAHLLAGQPARRPVVLDGLQRGLQHRRRVLRRRGADLLVLERRLPGLVHPGADRLLPAAAVPARDEPAGSPAGDLLVDRPGDGGAVLRHLVVRRLRVRADRQHPHLLLHRVGRRAVVPAVLLVPGLCRGPEARGDAAEDLPATAAGD